MRLSANDAIDHPAVEMLFHGPERVPVQVIDVVFPARKIFGRIEPGFYAEEPNYTKDEDMKRRDFLKLVGTTIATASVGTLAGKAFGQETATGAALPAPTPASGTITATSNLPHVIWVEGGEPAALLEAALKEMGGIGTFVTPGDVVVVKPNIGWDRTPELAGTTNPDLVAAIVRECLKAGAAKVKVFDRTCNNPLRCYANSGIEEKAAAAGAEVSHMEDSRFKEVQLPNGTLLKQWPIYQDYLEATKVINVPIAKHHGMSKVTLGLKNLMGVMGGPRGKIHKPFTKNIVDIAGAILPTLTIIDAYRVLLRNGPIGGNLEDVKLAKTLIMSPCTVSADVAALPLFGHSIGDVEYLGEAVSRGLAKYPTSALEVRKVVLPG